MCYPVCGRSAGGDGEAVGATTSVRAETALSWCQRLLGMKKGVRTEARREGRRLGGGREGMVGVRMDTGFHLSPQV